MTIEEKRIKLTEDIMRKQMFDIYQQGQDMNDFVRHFFASSLFSQILDDNKKIPKLELKLKMMEISFEQINNSRNDLIKELADCEMLNKELKEK